MLLNELLNVPFNILIEREAREKRTIGSIPVIVTDQDPKSFTRTKKRGQPMGVGIQSSAYDHKNGVVKYTDVQNDNDPAVKYINISLYNQKNPYMPKYKNVKIYQDSKGHLTMVTVAEKLSGTLSDMTPEQLNGLRKIKLSSTGQAEFERNKEKYRAHHQGDELDAKALGMMFRSEDKTDLGTLCFATMVS